jgi:hypothetical protein
LTWTWFLHLDVRWLMNSIIIIRHHQTVSRGYVATQMHTHRPFTRVRDEQISICSWGCSSPEIITGSSEVLEGWLGGAFKENRAPLIPFSLLTVHNSVFSVPSSQDEIKKKSLVSFLLSSWEDYWGRNIFSRQHRSTHDAVRSLRGSPTAQTVR